MEWCIHDSFYRKHHFIYREELEEDGEKKKKVDCSWCHEPIRGSFHNCVECCNQPVHMSSNEHCLDFTEKLENDGNKLEVYVYCSGCDEPVLGAAYKCSVSECSFLIHKSCTELSYHINHPLHPHTLSLQPLSKNCCDICCRSHDRSFFYRCTSCSFKLDIKCAYNPLPVNPNDCLQHEFFSISRRIQFNCDACGEEITNLAYRVCNICKILVHYRCAEIPRTTKIKLHNHLLNLVYSLPEIKKKHENIFCRICYEKVNKEYAAYYCQECSYTFHTECLRRFRNLYGELPASSMSVPNKSVGHVTHLIKALNQAEDKGPHPREIQHFSHQQHKLILCDDDINNDKFCEGCMELIISVPFYSCVQCNLFLHIRCTNFPQGLSNTDLISSTRLPSSHRHLPRVAYSFVIFVLVIIVASPTNVTHVLGAKPLTFNVVQSRKSLNTKVINIPFILLYILIIENAKLVLRTTRNMYSYASVAISSWE